MKELNTNKRLWMNLGIITLALAISIYALWYFKSVSGYFLLGILSIYVIKPLTSWLGKFGLSKDQAFFFIVLAFAGLLIFSASSLIPIVQQESNTMLEKWSLLEQNIKNDVLRPVEVNGQTVYYAPIFDVEVSLSSLKDVEVNFFGLIDNFISYIFSTIIFILIIVPVITYILIKQGSAIKKEFLIYVPNRYFEFVISTIYEVDTALRDFVLAKVIQSFIVTLVAAILFIALGVKLPIILAIVIGVFNIIPYFGPFIGLIVTVLTTLLVQGFDFAILTFIVIAITQIVDNAYLQPFLIARLVDQHPLIVIATTLIGAQLMGVIGMILAVPIYSVLKIILVKSYYALDVAYSRENAYDKLICSIR